MQTFAPDILKNMIFFFKYSFCGNITTAQICVNLSDALVNHIWVLSPNAVWVRDVPVTAGIGLPLFNSLSLSALVQTPGLWCKHPFPPTNTHTHTHSLDKWINRWTAVLCCIGPQVEWCSVPLWMGDTKSCAPHQGPVFSTLPLNLDKWSHSTSTALILGEQITLSPFPAWLLKSKLNPADTPPLYTATAVCDNIDPKPSNHWWISPDCRY